MATRRKSLIIDSFENFEHFENVAASRWEGENRNITDSGRSSDKSPKESWDFNTGLKKSNELMQHGWTDGQEKLNNLTGLDVAANATEYSRRASWGYDVAGSRPDVQRFCAGDMYNMASMTMVEQQGRARVVSIAAPVGVHCHWKSGEFFNRGAAYLKIIDALESQGTQVELYAYVSVGLSDYETTCKNHLTMIKIKSADQPIEADRLAFVFAHPAFFRRQWFSFAELSENLRDSTNGGYGRTQDISDLNDTAKKDIKAQFPNTVFLPCGACSSVGDNVNFKNYDRGLKTLKKALEKKGVHVTDQSAAA